MSDEKQIVAFLSEIAAQLASLNEQLEKGVVLRMEQRSGTWAPTYY
jgi:hypothetical protein